MSNYGGICKNHFIFYGHVVGFSIWPEIKHAVKLWFMATLTLTVDLKELCHSIYVHAGYLWKDKSENGVRKILEDNVIPLDRLMVETDAPFMYPNTRASKLPQNVKDCLTEK